MDEMVLKTQVYLNAMYGGTFGYEIIPENGKTGWTTIYALTRALQIELGITTTADSFGPTTTAKFNERFPNGIQQQSNGDNTEDNIYAIIQGALWCKGYSTGATGITKHFYGGTGSAIMALKTDAGLTNPTSTVTLEVMKALLSMNQYVVVYGMGGTSKIRTIQQYLNSKYMNYIGLAPCDGIYAREMNQAMIKVLQAIEGFSVSEATGYFGAGTKSRLPLLPSVTNAEATYLFRAALCCNGYDVSLSTSWDAALERVITQFQNDMLLEVTKMADVNTWMALLVSRGNTDRASNGCDTRFEITDERLATLKANNYQVVGRYLTGGSFKELREGEAERIIAGGMKMYPIFQESGADLGYFTEERGAIDAEKSTAAARKYGMPIDTIIYFAVDTDPQNTDITEKILPYFKGLSEHFDPDYKIGVYGTRNVCTQVCEKGYAVTSFVSDMSYGFSGNMGFKIPENWNLDQYYEIKTSESGWDFDLDKTMYSGRFPVVEHIEHSTYQRPDIPVQTGLSVLDIIGYIESLEYVYYNSYKPSWNKSPLDVVLGVTNYLRNKDYAGFAWYFTTANPIDTDFVDHIEKEEGWVLEGLKPFIGENRINLSDAGIGSIDLAHLAATLEGYLSTGLPPSFWAGWGGDLATGMADTQNRYEKQNDAGYEIYAGKDVKAIAEMTVGNVDSRCNYSDFCCDFDAYGIKKIIERMMKEEACNYRLLSSAMQEYYTSEYVKRFEQIFDELDCPKTLGGLRNAVHEKMNGAAEKVGLLPILAKNPSDSVNKACCDSFAEYIYSMLEF